MTQRDPKPRRTAFYASLLAVLAIGLTSSGCGYIVGGAYTPEIRSVHVPVFESRSFRRGYEYQLTEAVQKEIQNRSHFRLAKEPMADSRLTGRLVSIRKRALTESNSDNPRELELEMAIEVTWEDLRTGRILAQQQIALEPEVVDLLARGRYAPEVGQSLATGTKEVTDRLARQVVDMMEMPW